MEKKGAKVIKEDKVRIQEGERMHKRR